MLVSALVVTWNSDQHIAGCLDAVLAQEGVDVEVVVVDNASADGTRAVLAGYGDAITVLAQDSNLGYAAGNNVAARAARGDLLWLVNPDCSPAPECLRLLVEHLDATPSCGVAAAPLYDPDGTPQLFARRDTTFVESVWAFCETARLADLRWRGGRHAAHRRYAGTDLHPPTGAVTVDVPAAACVVIAASARSEPLLDEEFPLFFNDTDLYRRLRTEGLSCDVVGGARASHHYGASVRTLDAAAYRAEVVASLLRYERRHWGTVRTAVLLLALVLDAAVLRAARRRLPIAAGTFGALGLGEARPWLATPVRLGVRRTAGGRAAQTPADGSAAP